MVGIDSGGFSFYLVYSSFSLRVGINRRGSSKPRSEEAGGKSDSDARAAESHTNRSSDDLRGRPTYPSILLYAEPMPTRLRRCVIFSNFELMSTL